MFVREDYGHKVLFLERSVRASTGTMKPAGTAPRFGFRKPLEVCSVIVVDMPRSECF